MASCRPVAVRAKIAYHYNYTRITSTTQQQFRMDIVPDARKLRKNTALINVSCQQLEMSVKRGSFVTIISYESVS